MLTAALLVGLVACSSDGDPAAESNTGSSDSVATSSTVPDTTVPDTADTATTDTADTVTTDAALADPVTAESVQLTDEPDTTFESLDASADGSTIAFDNERGVGVLTVESGDISYVVENDDTTTATKPTYLGDGRLAVLIAEPGDVGGTINIVDESGALQPLDLPVTVVDIEGGTNDTIVYVALTEGGTRSRIGAGRRAIARPRTPSPKGSMTRIPRSRPMARSSRSSAPIPTMRATR